MAAADVASQPPPAKKKPFANWVKRITHLKGSDQEQDSAKKKRLAKNKKANGNCAVKNNPYPESGALKPRNHSPASSANGQLSFATSLSRGQEDAESYHSRHAGGDVEEPHSGNKSGAPTLATIPGTIQSDAGHSKAATATTGGGALSSIDGAGAGSTFSSPAPSERSLATTLTTIQSQAPGTALQNGASGLHSSNNYTQNQVMFTHQYPTSPGPTSAGLTASAIPRHLSEASPSTYNSATANNLLTDNASILTLASSSKRRRRSMDTDASVRAIPPSSVWGGSRESLPLSVLSGGMDRDRDTGTSTAGAPASAGGLYSASQPRPSVGGLGSAQAERASVYSSYSHKVGKERDLGDAKSLRSITNLDARSQYDARSIGGDARSQLGDVASLKNHEGSVRSGLLGHGRSDSIGSPLASPGLRQSGGLPTGRRSTDWQEMMEKSDEEGADYGEERDDVDGESHVKDEGNVGQGERANKE